VVRGDQSSYEVRILRLGEESADDAKLLSPSERFLIVWDLTRTAWAFKKGREVEPRLRRDVVRVVRRGR
jgi:hypothetical protein